MEWIMLPVAGFDNLDLVPVEEPVCRDGGTLNNCSCSGGLVVCSCTGGKASQL